MASDGVRAARHHEGLISRRSAVHAPTAHAVDAAVFMADPYLERVEACARATLPVVDAEQLDALRPLKMHSQPRIRLPIG